MKRFLKWTVRVVATLLIIVAGLAIWRWEDINRLMAVNSMFTEGKIVNNFSSMDTMFHTVVMDVPNDAPAPLPVALRDMPASLDGFVTDRNVTAIVVLKDGQIAYENYYLGTGAEDLRISWSVAKSYLSALMGIVLAEGAIASIDDPVTTYAPSLTGTAYDGATIRNVLNMASGVVFNEDYLDFNSDINKMGRIIGLGGSMDGFAEGLMLRDNDPGTQWRYVSIDTHILGMVIRGATGRSIPDLLAEKLLTPLGMEADPYYVTDGYGVAFVLGGLNIRTRDYARFGLMILNNGRLNDVQIVPPDWVAQTTVASAPNTPRSIDYGMQWWVPSDATDGEFFARGIYGQYIYINQPEGVVIALNSADRAFRSPGVFEQNLRLFREVVEDLRDE